MSEKLKNVHDAVGFTSCLHDPLSHITSRAVPASCELLKHIFVSGHDHRCVCLCEYVTAQVSTLTVFSVLAYFTKPSRACVIVLFVVLSIVYVCGMVCPIGVASHVPEGVLRAHVPTSTCLLAHVKGSLQMTFSCTCLALVSRNQAPDIGACE